MHHALRRPTREDLRWFVGVPLRPQTYLNLLYLGLAFPLGIAYFVLAVVGLALGVSLAIILIGIPILLLLVLSALGIAAFELWLADRLLDVQAGGAATESADTDKAETKSESTDDRPPTRKVLTILLDIDTWKAVGFLPLKFVFGIAALVTMMLALSTGVSMVFTPLYYSEPGLYVGVTTDRPIELHPTLHVGWNRLLVTLETVVTIGFWRIERLWQALIVAAFGGLLSLTALHLLNGIAYLAGRATNWLLRDAHTPFESL